MCYSYASLASATPTGRACLGLPPCLQTEQEGKKVQGFSKKALLANMPNYCIRALFILTTISSSPSYLVE